MTSVTNIYKRLVLINAGTYLHSYVNFYVYFRLFCILFDKRKQHCILLSELILLSFFKTTDNTFYCQNDEGTYNGTYKRAQHIKPDILYLRTSVAENLYRLVNQGNKSAPTDGFYHTLIHSTLNDKTKDCVFYQMGNLSDLPRSKNDIGKSSK